MSIKIIKGNPDKFVFLEFDKDTVDTILKICNENETIINITLKITEAFDATKTLSVGIPADHEAFVSASDIDVEEVEITEHQQWYRCPTSKTLTLFSSGASATGAGQIFVEFL